jgi:hypothetical protein
VANYDIVLLVVRPGVPDFLPLNVSIPKAEEVYSDIASCWEFFPSS